MRGSTFRSPTVLITVLVVFAATVSAQQRSFYQQTQYKGQEIGKLTGDVYYARMDDYVSVFMVTPEGIILAEPIGTEMAAWLKPELSRRFNVPVKYVLFPDEGHGWRKTKNRVTSTVEIVAWFSKWLGEMTPKG